MTNEVRSTMLIRRLRPGEERQVHLANGLLDAPADAGAVRSYLEDERNLFLLAYEGEVPTGFLRGTELGQITTARRQMFLYEIAVDERFRRRGVARSLIDWLLRYCEAKDFEEIFVFTDPSNEAAVGLYRSTGAITETDADRMFVYQLPLVVGTRSSEVR